MGKDVTPDEIELKSRNFTNENHEHIAGILEREWDASTTFSELGEKYDAHRATFQKVYNRYFGVPGDDRTVEQLKSEYGSMKEFLNLLEMGQIDDDTDDDEDPLEEMVRLMKNDFYSADVIKLIQEAYRRGYQDGIKDKES